VEALVRVGDVGRLAVKRCVRRDAVGNPGEQFPVRKAAQKSSKGDKDQEHDEAGEVTSQHNTSSSRF
jgi:hypothetical protein